LRVVRLLGPWACTGRAPASATDKASPADADLRA
jgi:hypothetical protein